MNIGPILKLETMRGGLFWGEVPESHVLTFCVWFMAETPHSNIKEAFLHKYRLELCESENHWHVGGDGLWMKLLGGEHAAMWGSRKRLEEALHSMASWKRMNLQWKWKRSRVHHTRGKWKTRKECLASCCESPIWREWVFGHRKDFALGQLSDFCFLTLVRFGCSILFLTVSCKTSTSLPLLCYFIPPSAKYNTF